MKYRHLLTLVFLFAIAPAVEGGVEPGTISGVVTLNAGPVEGANVCATTFESGETQYCGATTDATGSFALEVPPASDYRVEATVPGLNTQCFDDIDDCLVGQGWSSGYTPVAVTTGAATPDVDFGFGCGDGSVLLFDTADTGAVGWTTGGLWHVASNPACSPASRTGTSSFYYGQASCDYDTGGASSGTLLSPVVSNVAAGAQLSFWQRRKTDGGCTTTDTTKVLVWVNGFGPFEVASECSETDAWEARLHDLTFFYNPGDSLQIGFEFDTVDGAANDALGWMIDDVRLFGCGHPPACPDPDADGVCSSVDNCPDAFNPRQADRDTDGTGNACDPLQVDFAPVGATVAQGFLHDDGSTWDGVSGHGWDAPVLMRDRGGAVAQELATFAFSVATRTWTRPVANGLYTVRVVAGDADWPQGPHRVVANGVTLVDDRTTAAGEFIDVTLPVLVRDGLLSLEIGGAPGPTMVNLLEATEWDDRSLVGAFNFQPAGAATPDGYLADAGLVFAPGPGFGWASKTPVRERGENVPGVLDTLVFSAGVATWELELPHGAYSVHVTVGDAGWAQGPHRVLAEGAVVVDGVSTAAGQHHDATAVVAVTDGRLTVEIGGGGGITALDQITVSVAPDDVDADGAPNGTDNCPADANALQTDTDADALGDVCDDDDDGDGAPDGVDNCPLTSNALQTDTDGDGAGDACDGDDDGDSVEDGSDNCPLVPNAAQSDRDGDGAGNVCDPIRIDFAPAAASPPAGFLHADGLPFLASRGHGWDGFVLTRERTGAPAPELDTFAFTQSVAVWTLELPNGEYSARVVVGDPSFAQGPHRVVANGVTVVADVATASGDLAEATALIEVTNGRLELAVGGTAGNTAINVVELTELEPAVAPVAINFQPAAAAVPEDYLVDSGLAYDPGRTYGWTVPRPSRERARDVPQTLDTFVFSSAVATWELDLAPGTWEVTVAVGDARYAQGPQRVVVEGTTAVNDVSTPAGDFFEATVTVPVTDGKLTVQIGGAGGTTALDQIVVRPGGP